MFQNELPIPNIKKVTTDLVQLEKKVWFPHLITRNLILHIVKLTYITIITYIIQRANIIQRAKRA